MLSKSNLKPEDIRFVVGLDIAKNVFQVYTIDQETGEIEFKSIKRDDLLKHFTNKGPCLIGIEACSTSQHWARRLKALCHAVKLPKVMVIAYKMLRACGSPITVDAYDMMTEPAAALNRLEKLLMKHGCGV